MKNRHKLLALIIKFLTLFFLLAVLLLLALVLQRLVYINGITRPQVSFPLKLKWQVDLGRFTYERPAYENGLVMLPASNFVSSYWYGIDVATRQIVWSQAVNQYNFRRCLTAEYLVLSGPRSFITLKTHTGEIVWEEKRGARSASCDEKSVFSTTFGSGSLIAVRDLATGEQRWLGDEPRKTFGSLIYNPETRELIAEETLVPGDFYIVDPQSGLLKYSFSKVDSAPDDGSWERGPMYLIDQGEFFLGGTVLNAKTGEIIHQEEHYKTLRPPVVTTDTMYLSSFFAGIVAFDRTTYNVKWVYQPQPAEPLNPLAPIAILDGIGYAIFSDATVRAFDLNTGQELGYWQPEVSELWWWPICAFPPGFCIGSARAGLVASDDTLFISFGDGKLYTFGR